jgi:hypothetical protein
MEVVLKILLKRRGIRTPLRSWSVCGHIAHVYLKNGKEVKLDLF